VAELIRKKEITSLEAVEDVSRRIQSINPRINDDGQDFAPSQATRRV
jgi:hypothetical protein